MIQVLQCHNHNKPIDIISSNKGNCVAFCQICFQQFSKEHPQSQAVRLNNHTLNIFNSFSTYVLNKLLQWNNIVRRSGYEGIFQKTAHGQHGRFIQSDSQKLKTAALEIIQDYRTLLRSNRDYVISNKNAQILYHPQFLKDLYNLILVHWKISGDVIANNFNEKITKIIHNRNKIVFTIKQNLLSQIEKQRLRIINQQPSSVIVKPIVNDKFKHVQRVQSVNMVNPHITSIEGQDFPKSSQDKQISQFDVEEAPFLIKKIESFQEIKPTIESQKVILSQETFLQLKNMKKSKLVDQKDYNQLNMKFVVVLKDLQNTKLENDNLRSENIVLKNQKHALNQDNQILRKRYQKLINESKKHLTSEKKSHSKTDSDTQLFLQVVQLQAEVTDCKHDIEILIQCINSIGNMSLFEKTNLNKKLTQLRTIHYTN